MAKGHKIKDAPFTQAYLRQILQYDEETGVFTWRVRLPQSQIRNLWNRRYAGKEAGHIMPSGYSTIRLKPRHFYAHQLAWFYVYGEWPTCDIDHINMERSDNRISNLRKATRSQNKGNVKAHPRNTSGTRGVVWDKHRQKWRAQIMINGRQTNLGRYDTFADAKKAFDQAAIPHWGEFLRQN